MIVGDGDQAAAVERLRSEPKSAGWFDDEQKQQPPAFPGRLASSSLLRRCPVRHPERRFTTGPTTSAAIEGRNRPEVERAEMSIANGIHHLETARSDVDAIIVGRGGGIEPPGIQHRIRSPEACCTPASSSRFIGHR